MSTDTGGYHAHHDMGGEAAGPIDQSPHDRVFWEKRVDALMTLLSAPDRGLLRVDELRRGIESLGAYAYDRMSYYERWIASITNIMVEKGVLSQEEIDARIAELKARGVGQP